MTPLIGTLSGEISATKKSLALGVINFPGKIRNVIASVSTAGKNDSSVPTVTVDVMINGTTIFTTKPIIAHVSGETAQHKTTYSEAGDTGITAPVIDEDANTFAIGDIITWTATYSGSTTPTTKMANVNIVVEVQPV
jgi:hypothetical protein